MRGRLLTLETPCLLPQLGAGRRFLRGLLHSDGSRATNTIHTNGRTYACPRYHFTNHSGDLMRLCEESLDRLGITWRMCMWKQVPVARREAVAALDVRVGPEA
ncbi:hypothetical protein Sya03_26630 [Spirilliplanes yamanashiensis]|uniref:Uncharacterized protein n=1 Tax=Spirilliplanes yamanashiensis TaxID=42233 RepID=A0A8J4DJ18_9ACTN|nr:hypothetical protein Sya03_26630 [Spirilliplanes yamanashiensis]